MVLSFFLEVVVLTVSFKNYEWHGVDAVMLELVNPDSRRLWENIEGLRVYPPGVEGAEEMLGEPDFFEEHATVESSNHFPSNPEYFHSS